MKGWYFDLSQDEADKALFIEQNHLKVWQEVRDGRVVQVIHFYMAYFIECWLKVPFQPLVWDFLCYFNCMLNQLAPNLVQVLMGMSELNFLLALNLSLPEFLIHYHLAFCPVDEVVNPHRLDWYYKLRLGKRPLITRIPDHEGNWHTGQVYIESWWRQREIGYKLPHRPSRDEPNKLTPSLFVALLITSLTLLFILEHSCPRRFNRADLDYVRSLPEQYRASYFLSSYIKIYTTYAKGTCDHSARGEFLTELQGLFEDMSWLDHVLYANIQVELWEWLGQWPLSFTKMTPSDDVVAQY